MTACAPGRPTPTGIGAIFSALGMLLLLARAVALGSGIWHILSFTVYGLSMICLYTASTLYHSVNTSVQGRIALRKYDHSSIYFLIAGTYTPMCLVVLRESGAWGWVMLGLVWGLALAGADSQRGLDLRPPLALRGHLYRHGLAGCIRLSAAAPLASRRGFFLAVGRRHALYRRRCALCRQMARPEQSPLWVPRNLPRVHCARLCIPLSDDVSGGGVALKQTTKTGSETDPVFCMVSGGYIRWPAYRTRNTEHTSSPFTFCSSPLRRMGPLRNAHSPSGASGRLRN